MISTPSNKGATSLRPHGILFLLLVLSYVVIWKTTDVSTEAVAGLSMNLPSRIGDWMGEPVPVQPIEREYLGIDTEFARRLYRHPDGHEIFLGIVLSGRDRSTIHAAEACLVGQGWTLAQGELFTVPMDQPHPYSLRTMRLTITRDIPQPQQQKLHMRNWYIYWFVGKDRLTPRHLSRVLWTAWDRIFLNVHHRWGYVTVNLAVPPGREKELEQTVTDFMKQAVPTFQKVTD